MGFYETPLRRLRLARACCALVLAVAFLLIPFLVALDMRGTVLSFVAAGACLVAALVLFRMSRRTPVGEVDYAFPNFAPPGEQRRMYRRLLRVSLVAFPVVSAAVAYELHQLESGAPQRVRIWAPLVPVYERLGFWPAVLAPLLLGAVVCAVFVAKLRGLSRGAARRPPGD